MTGDPFATDRQRMVEEQIVRRGIRDSRLIAALLKIPRHLFVPDELIPRSHDDGPLPIGFGQTISQPYIVAYMTEKLQLTGREKVLEIGTGSGYQTAMLAECSGQVYSIEIIPELGLLARKRLVEEMHYPNIHLRIGRGQEGWQEFQLYDRILLTAAPERTPAALFDQLAVDGVLLAPEGKYMQKLNRYRKSGHGIKREELIGVAFVPLLETYLER